MAVKRDSIMKEIDYINNNSDFSSDISQIAIKLKDYTDKLIEEINTNKTVDIKRKDFFIGQIELIPSSFNNFTSEITTAVPEPSTKNGKSLPPLIESETKQI